MVGTDHLLSVPPVKDRVGSIERDGAITVKPDKQSLFKGRGNIFFFHYANFKTKEASPAGCGRPLLLSAEKGTLHPCWFF